MSLAHTPDVTHHSTANDSLQALTLRTVMLPCCYCAVLHSQVGPREASQPAGPRALAAHNEECPEPHWRLLLKPSKCGAQVVLRLANYTQHDESCKQRKSTFQASASHLLAHRGDREDHISWLQSWYGSLPRVSAVLPVCVSLLLTSPLSWRCRRFAPSTT